MAVSRNPTQSRVKLKIMKTVLLPILGASLIIFFMGLYVSTAEAVLPKGTELSAPIVAPNAITPGFDTEFFVTEKFPDMPSNFKPVVQILTTSKKWKNIGRLRDDGKGGDPKGGDHVFSILKRVRLTENAESISFRVVAKGEMRTLIVSPVRVVTRSGGFIIPQGWYHGGFNEGLGIVNFPPDQTPNDGPLKSGLAYASVNWMKKSESITLKDFALQEVGSSSEIAQIEVTQRVILGLPAIQVRQITKEPGAEESFDVFIEKSKTEVVDAGILFLASSPNRTEILNGLEQFLSGLVLDVPFGGVE